MMLIKNYDKKACTVLATGKLTIRVRPFNGTGQAARASAGYRQQKLLLFRETPDHPDNHYKKELRGLPKFVLLFVCWNTYVTCVIVLSFTNCKHQTFFYFGCYKYRKTSCSTIAQLAISVLMLRKRDLEFQELAQYGNVCLDQ